MRAAKSADIQHLLRRLAQITKTKRELAEEEKKIRERILSLVPVGSRFRVENAVISVYETHIKQYDPTVQAQLQLLERMKRELLEKAEQEGKFKKVARKAIQVRLGGE